MAKTYALYVRHEVFQSLRELSRPRRERILAFIESLAADPFQSGDYSTSDRSGRLWQVKIVDRFAVIFWTDHAAKEVKVVDLVDADGQ